MQDWYYSENGAAQGPVLRAELAAMLQEGALPSSTQVWTESFGDNWRRADQTDLMPKRSGPPPLPTAPVATPPALEAVSARQPLMPRGVDGEPDALGGGWAMLIALAPLIVLAIDVAITMAAGYPSELTDRIVNVWGSIAIFACAAFDSRAVTRAGLNPKGRYLVPFMLLTPIGYFLRRASVTGTSLRHLWIWLGCAAALVVGEFGLLGAQG